MPQQIVPTTQAPRAQWKHVQKTLRSTFQFKELRPGQEEIIRSVLAGKDTLAIMPTGGGKSLCYQLPALHLEGTTIVISPLISLMKDQREKIEEKGIGAVEFNSTVNKSETAEGLTQIQNKSSDILYVTPERFSNSEFLSSIEEEKIDFVVIDEAHCVSQWGHDFRPAYLALSESLKRLKSPPVLCLTATATDEVAEDIKKQLGLKELEVFRSSVFRENLFFEAKYLTKAEEKMTELLSIVRELQHESGIIYTATVKAAEEIHDFLNENGISSILYHGKLKPNEREENQNEFMNQSPRLMVATNAFGMGVDKPDIRFVIHFQFPGSLEAYYQEAGRAGRDGEFARCILLYLKKDKSTQSLFLSGRYPTADEVVAVYSILQNLTMENPNFDKEEATRKISEIIPKKKVAVVFSLLKQLKVLKATPKKGWTLAKKNLSTEEIHSLAEVYREREIRDKEKLNGVIKYAQSALCRWKNILKYFEEDPIDGACGHCDNCTHPSRQTLSQSIVMTPSS